MSQSDDHEGDGSLSLYDACAFEEARVTGLYDDELAAVLCGKSPTEVFLPLSGELFILYGTRWPSDADG